MEKEQEIFAEDIKEKIEEIKERIKKTTKEAGSKKASLIGLILLALILINVLSFYIGRRTVKRMKVEVE